MHSPYSNNLRRAPYITTVGTIFIVFCYDVVSGLSLPRRRADAQRVEQRSKTFHYLKLYQSRDLKKYLTVIYQRVTAQKWTDILLKL